MENLRYYGRAVLMQVFIIAVFICGALLIKNVYSEPVDTYHSEWVRIKDSAAEDGADFATTLDIDANDGDFASKLSSAYQITSRGWSGQPYTSSAGGAWMFAFYGTDAADETFSFNLVGWSKGNGMAQIICEGDGVLGTQDVVIEPNSDSIKNGFWADTINLDETTKWPSVAVYNSGDNEVAILVVDLTGLEWIDFVTYDVAGTAEATSIGVYGRLY